ncbi:hypothetical protein IKF94_01690 [Candidatus Saccharibacteria bacterium]|nr:hypothetical protein [Candidatus Saccharibacteria bacterium]
MSEQSSMTEHVEVIEYTKENAHTLPLEFRQEIDEMLILHSGADAPIVWEMGGKVYLRKYTYEEDDSIVNYQLGGLMIVPGYNKKHHLYAYDNKIYVEDDYIWRTLSDSREEKQTDFRSVCLNPNTNINAFIAEAAGFTDENHDLEEEELDLDDIAEPVTNASSKNPMWINFEPEKYNTEYVTYEPLAVDKFDIDNPLCKVEVAYRNALCEAESRPDCGWVILLHDGHFYVPVEDIEDPVNRDVFHFIKIFNSYPVGYASPRATTVICAEIFDESFSIGVRYRKGYSVNWRKFFFEHFLPKDYLDHIMNFYDVSDKPYSMRDNHLADYDGFMLRYTGNDDEGLRDYEVEIDEDDNDDGDDDDKISNV